jgi:geranylgeranyl pyrophosphate synthase
MRHYLDSGGKRMHGLAVALAYRACGGASFEKIVPIAAAFQLYHHHTLVHDDIYDEDISRRGWPTTHRAFASYFEDVSHAGEGERVLFASEPLRRGAITAFAYGKICRALAGNMIVTSEFPEAARLDVARAFDWHDLFDNAAQLQDVYHEGGGIPAPETCLDNAWQKTGRLFEVCAYAGARLADASPSQVAALERWAGLSALAYQLQDDLEDLVPDSEKGQGRGVGTDLVRCKPTYLFATAISLAEGQDRAVLFGWQSGAVEGLMIGDVITVLERCGAIEACRRKVDECVAQACASIDTATPAFPNPKRAAMVAFTRYFVSSAYWRRQIKTDEARAAALLV